ncbi:MAG TPA: hypothetical protein VFZ15_02730 [Acidimicrobiia bacterium]|nr:hypothetical protein [Acidimicrobiia bacterium]
MTKPAALIVLALFVAACASTGGFEEQPEATASTVAETGDTTTTEEPTLHTLPSSEEDLLTLAMAARSDLAQRLGVPETEIAVTGASLVTWNDGSIGCPQPGVSYTQALVEGARVTLLHEGTTYAYHQGGNDLFLCEEPAEGSFVVSKDDSGELELIPPPGYND